MGRPQVTPVLPHGTCRVVRSSAVAFCKARLAGRGPCRVRSDALA
jgi:hypothetical protein